MSELQFYAHTIRVVKLTKKTKTKCAYCGKKVHNMTYHYNNRCKVKNVSCVYCGKKVYSIFIRTDHGVHIKPRNLKDFYYCKKHGILHGMWERNSRYYAIPVLSDNIHLLARAMRIYNNLDKSGDLQYPDEFAKFDLQ